MHRCNIKISVIDEVQYRILDFLYMFKLLLVTRSLRSSKTCCCLLQNENGQVWSMARLRNHLGASEFAKVWSRIERSVAMTFVSALPRSQEVSVWGDVGRCGKAYFRVLRRTCSGFTQCGIHVSIERRPLLSKEHFWS